MGTAVAGTIPVALLSAGVYLLTRLGWRPADRGESIDVDLAPIVTRTGKVAKRSREASRAFREPLDPTEDG